MLQYFELLQPQRRFIVSSGNHDLTGEDANGERAAVWLGQARRRGIPTDGDAVLIGDTLITVCPWWDGPHGRDTVAAQLARDGAERPARWIWIYHWPPLGSPTAWTGKRFYGDEELGRLDRGAPPGRGAQRARPSAAVQARRRVGDRIGHTWVFNPGARSAAPLRASRSTSTPSTPRGRRSWASSRSTSRPRRRRRAPSSDERSVRQVGLGIRREPVAAVLSDSARFGIRLSTADTIEIPGTCAYWRVTSATYSVSSVSRSASPMATCNVIVGSLPSSSRPSAAWRSTLGSTAATVAVWGMPRSSEISPMSWPGC